MTAPEREQDLPLHPLPASARALRQLAASATVGVLVAVTVALLTPVAMTYSVLLGWVAGGCVYLFVVWRSSWRLDAEATAEAAEREDPSRAAADVVLLTAAVVSLVAVVLAIADASSAHGLDKLLRVLLGIAAVITSWLLVHTLFTMKYARAYFAGPVDDGIDFNSDKAPVWSDFAYLAFTVGMTFQISDTDLKTSPLRRIALRHMLLSYVFGAVIIAVTINLVAGLSH